MNYFFYALFGILPSLIWLIFYLRKDAHPEPKSEVMKVFLYGMIIAFLAIVLERGFFKIIPRFGFSPYLTSILNIFIGVALVEELLKYLVVKMEVISNPEFDEPTDAMLYMIISGLGFAASENLLIILPLEQTTLLSEVISISLLRFLGATFLHALCSGLIGFFLALSFFETKHRLGLILAGLSISTFLHGLYDFSIMNIGGALKLQIILIILVGLALFVSFGFKKLKGLKSICKI